MCNFWKDFNVNFSFLPRKNLHNIQFWSHTSLRSLALCQFTKFYQNCCTFHWDMAIFTILHTTSICHLALLKIEPFRYLPDFTLFCVNCKDLCKTGQCAADFRPEPIFNRNWSSTLKRCELLFTVTRCFDIFSGNISMLMSLMQCWCQVTQQGVIIDASVVEVINCVYQKSHSYKTTPSPACILGGCTVLSIVRNATTTPGVQPRTTVNRLHARSAMYLSDQPSWWSRPVTRVQLAGHVSTTGIWWRSIHCRWGRRRLIITAQTTFVSTQILKLQLGRFINLNRFFISPKSVVELCHVPSFTTAGMCRVWCAPNDNRLYKGCTWCFIVIT